MLQYRPLKIFQYLNMQMNLKNEKFQEGILIMYNMPEEFIVAAAESDMSMYLNEFKELLARFAYLNGY